MFFRRRRLVGHLTTHKWHLDKIYELEQLRDKYEAAGRKAILLAANFEIVSHTSRALAELRKAEEIARGSVKGDPMREFLQPKLSLPAIRRDQVETTPAAEIDALFARFMASDKGKSERQTQHEERDRLGM